MELIKDFLERSPWSAGLAEDVMAQVSPDVTCRFYSAGSIIAPRAQRLNHWLGVMNGVAVLGCDSPGGKPAYFIPVSEGGWFGEGSLLKDEPLRYEVLAKTDCRVACLPRDTFMWLFETSIAFNHALVHQLNERCGQFVGMVTLERTGSVGERVAKCLLSLINPVLYPGTGNALPLTQEEVGYLCGLSRQTVNAVLKDLEQAGLVRVDFKQVTVLDLTRMLEYAAQRHPEPPRPR
jgi:CRP/FNR family cyclic AMP-dependent transcriptional regulator